jgi:hypothetical protein
MKREGLKIRSFKSHEELDAYDREERRLMSPQERLDLVEYLRRQSAAFLNYEYDVPFRRVISTSRKT